MQVIEAFEQSPKRQSCDSAQNKAEAERQFGSPEYHVVVVDTSDSKDHTDSTDTPQERNQRQQPFADHAEDDADFPDLLQLCLNFSSHKISFEKPLH
jgi:hypothetical protein